MGSTGRLGPALAPRDPMLRRAADVAGGYRTDAVTLHGEDIYRLNCRGCHQESGQGAPPEINSVINPVRATSLPMVMEKMKARGLEVSAHDAAEMARQANDALLKRLHEGGENMPAFPQLSDPEVRALVAYLKQLAEVTGAAREQASLKASPVHIGEQIVKSTCHTCHGAMGTNPDAQQLLEGSIPPLSTLTTRVSRAEMIRKVTQGAPIAMGDPALPYRGRMPVFYYLTPEEVADVYLYLTLYPPGQNATEVAEADTLAMSAGGTTDSQVDPPPTAGHTMSTADLQAQNDDDGIMAILSLSVAALLAFLLLAFGVWLSVREMKKLSGVEVTDGVKAEPVPAAAIPANASAA